jgi:hypothetical protein
MAVVVGGRAERLRGILAEVRRFETKEVVLRRVRGRREGREKREGTSI